MTDPIAHCDTCCGEGVLVGTARDSRGGDRDVVEPCPDCTDAEALAEARERRRGWTRRGHVPREE